MSTAADRKGKETPCPVCDKLVYRYPSTLNQRFCSIACRATAVRAKRVNEVDGTAKCARCKEWKPINDFVRGRFGRPHSYCKPCSSDWFRVRRGAAPEKQKAYRPAYRLSDEEKRQAILESSRRNHLRRRAAGKPPPQRELSALWCFQHGRCAYCKRFLGTYHIDHKTPITRGGGNELSNLHLTCPICNMRKGTMTHDEFLASKKRPVVQWD